MVDIERVLVSCPLIVSNMFYPGTFLANNSSNTNVEIVKPSTDSLRGCVSMFSCKRAITRGVQRSDYARGEYLFL